MSNSDMRLLEILSLDARLSHEEIAVMMAWIRRTWIREFPNWKKRGL